VHRLPRYSEKLPDRMVGGIFFLQFYQLAFADFRHGGGLLSIVDFLYGLTLTIAE
jgi:hypothetical protein